VAAERAYFEDTVVGEQNVSPGLTITEAHVGLYRGLTGDGGEDPGAVPELLPLAIVTGLGWRLPRPPLAVKAFVGFEWEIVQPLRVGDTIHGTSRTAARRPMREAGMVAEDHEIIDQRGVVVQRGRFTLLVDKRPAGAAAARRTGPGATEVPS
jgi:acyl dehydratase